MTHSNARLAIQNIAGIIGFLIIFTTNSLVIFSQYMSQRITDLI